MLITAAMRNVTYSRMKLSIVLSDINLDFLQ